MGRVTYEVWFSDDYDNEYHIYENPIFRLDSLNGDWGLTIHWEGLWAFGAGISLLYLAWGYVRMCRDLKRRRQAPSEAELHELEKQRRLLMVLPNVQLYRVSGLGSPMLMGFFRPAVLLPENLPEGALAVTLAHELTHLKRRDLWYKLLLALARCLHWFNPMVWLMCRRAGRDVELCCDYDLLRSRDEDARRSYGQAILDQMTAGAPRNSRLTTGFSGDKQEVFTRFRAIMDTSVKKKGRAALALTLAVVLLGGGLVACQGVERSAPLKETVLAFSGIDKEMTRVNYEVVDWFDEEDAAAWDAWWKAHYENGDGESLYADLAQDAEILYRTEDGQTYPLNPATIEYSIWHTQDGRRMMELTFNEKGRVTRLVMRGGVSLDLNAADLDFTGYTGLVYAAGMGGISHASNTSFMNVDPCDLMGNDRDYTRYNLPLAEEAEIPDDLKPFIRGLSSGQYPELYQLQLVGGEVVSVTGLWEGENMQTSVGYAVLMDDYTGILGVQNVEELSYQPGNDFLMMGGTKLPLTEHAHIPDELLPPLSGEHQNPDLLQYALAMKDGAVTAVFGIWKNSTSKGDLPDYTGTLCGTEMRGLSEVNGKAYLILDGYRIPLEKAHSTELKEQLSSLSDTEGPSLYEATVVDGEVTAVEKIWTYQTYSETPG